jgi:hypothetical protein
MIHLGCFLAAHSLAEQRQQRSKFHSRNLYAIRYYLCTWNYRSCPRSSLGSATSRRKEMVTRLLRRLPGSVNGSVHSGQLHCRIRWTQCS